MNLLHTISDILISNFNHILFPILFDSYEKKVKKKGLVLIWEFGGYKYIFIKNAIIALALRLRGYQTLVIVCDGLPIACIRRGIEQGIPLELWKKTCLVCKKDIVDVAKTYHINYVFASDFITEEEKKNCIKVSEKILIRRIKNKIFKNVRVGELAFNTFNRYMKGSLINVNNLSHEEQNIYRKYFFAALINSCIADNIINELRLFSILTSHGVYTDYAPILYIAKHYNIPCTTWVSVPIPTFHYFNSSLNNISNKYIKDKLLKLRTSGRIKRRVSTFLSNKYGRDFYDDFNSENKKRLKKQLGIQSNKPVVCLFCHVNWDACFELSSMIFDNANEWVIESIKTMIKIKDVEWIIKVHPGEKIEGNIVSTSQIINKQFSLLPAHIHIVEASDTINPLDIFRIIDVGITIFGTIGIELPLLEKPVIAVGQTYYNADFTISPKSKREYIKILQNIHSIKPLTIKQVNHAYAYAYSYFIQRQIPFRYLVKNNHWGDFNINKLNELLPGKNRIMDALCRGIVKGHDVILSEQDIKSLYGY